MEKNDFLFLTPQIIVDELENRGYNFQFHRGNTAITFSDFKIISSPSASPDDRQSLYVAPQRLKKEFSQGAIVIFSSEDFVHIRKDCHIIHIFDPVNPYDIINHLQDIFHKYQLLDSQMQLFAQKGDIVTLAELGRAEFGNPLFIHDEQYNYIVNQHWSGSTALSTVNKRTGRNVIPSNQFQEMIESKAFSQTLDTHGASLYEDYPRVSNRILYTNIWDENSVYKGRICIDEISSSIQPGQFYLLNHFAKYVLLALKNSNLDLRRQIRDTELLLKDLLQEKSVDSSIVANILRQIQWNISDKYICCCLKSHQVHTDNRFSTACYEIENLLETSCAFIIEDAVCIIINITDNPLSTEDIQTTLSDFLTANDFVLGLSNPFCDIYKIVAAYITATSAIQIGLSQNTSCNFFSFSEFIVDYILHYDISAVSLDSLLAPELLLLMEHDKSNHTEYMQSLFSYIKYHGNVSRAADEMFIHRSTMNYRIERICELTDLDLDNYEKMLYLQISYALLNYSS